jgi:hypothetical protein
MAAVQRRKAARKKEEDEYKHAKEAALGKPMRPVRIVPYKAWREKRYPKKIIPRMLRSSEYLLGLRENLAGRLSPSFREDAAPLAHRRT